MGESVICVKVLQYKRLWLFTVLECEIRVHIRPNALCLYNLSRHAPHNDHFHESNGKQYCMLIQYIVGGYINPPLPVSVNLLGTKTPPRQATPATPPQEGN